ncbi:hypothetical protein [Serratia marcescens]|uniref:hypothetical protein n=1 Tax=Serratia TaxID=613 RepID=UPI0018D79078|nr:hypothetical protein [Serratia marcescens]MBN5409371.1 hypothetical protein [Serratia marcescens]HEJ7192097.1 hypothetical protein [Serratia marcescens]
MKRISVVGLMAILFFNSNLVKADTYLPKQSELINNFHSLNLVQQNQWQDAKSDSGMKLKTAQVGRDAYSISDNAVSAIMMLPGKDSKVEGAHVVSVCSSLARVVMPKVELEQLNSIKNVIVKSAMNMGSAENDLVNGYMFSAKALAFDSTPVIACKIEGFVTWN